MIHVLQVATVVLVAVGMAFSLAHAAELPGKLRLDEQTYRKVQPIYYPGFTIGGFVGELGAMVMLLVLALVSSAGTPQRVYAIVALLAMVAAHGVFWLVTQPVNRTWLKDTKLDEAGSRFFATGSRDPQELEQRADWRTLRNTWELSHAVRAVLALVALVLVVIGVTEASASA